MVECSVEKKQGTNSLARVLLIIITVAAVLGVVLSLIYPGFINLLSEGGAVYNVIYVVLTVDADALYLFGGGVIAFGAILVTIRFIQCKLKDPFQTSSSTRILSGYLTLGLNFFIGAEIIRTVLLELLASSNCFFL